MGRERKETEGSERLGGKKEQGHREVVMFYFYTVELPSFFLVAEHYLHFCHQDHVLFPKIIFI